MKPIYKTKTLLLSHNIVVLICAIGLLMIQPNHLVVLVYILLLSGAIFHMAYQTTTKEVSDSPSTPTQTTDAVDVSKSIDAELDFIKQQYQLGDETTKAKIETWLSVFQTPKPTSTNLISNQKPFEIDRLNKKNRELTDQISDLAKDYKTLMNQKIALDQALEKAKKDIKDFNHANAILEQEKANITKEHASINNILKKTEGNILQSFIDFYEANNDEKFYVFTDLNKKYILGNFIQERIDGYLTENIRFKSRLESIVSSKDKELFIVDEFINSHLNWLQLHTWYLKRRGELKDHPIQLHIELAWLAVNNFDAVYLHKIDHLNYRILAGENYFDLRKNSRMLNAFDTPQDLYEIIKYFQSIGSEPHTFIRENIICPIGLQIP
jgi:hypothetical protein